MAQIITSMSASLTCRHQASQYFQLEYFSLQRFDFLCKFAHWRLMLSVQESRSRIYSNDNLFLLLNYFHRVYIRQLQSNTCCCVEDVVGMWACFVTNETSFWNTAYTAFIRQRSEYKKCVTLYSNIHIHPSENVHMWHCTCK